MKAMNSIVRKEKELEGGKIMKKVITYGTYDLLHVGHINLLRRDVYKRQHIFSREILRNMKSI